jgi:hypothetical protein
MKLLSATWTDSQGVFVDGATAHMTSSQAARLDRYDGASDRLRGPVFRTAQAQLNNLSRKPYIDLAFVRSSIPR